MSFDHLKHIIHPLFKSGGFPTILPPSSFPLRLRSSSPPSGSVPKRPSTNKAKAVWSAAQPALRPSTASAMIVAKASASERKPWSNDIVSCRTSWCSERRRETLDKRLLHEL